MKEKINQLETLLKEITELIEQHIEISEIDIVEFDAREKNRPFPIDSDGSFRKAIVDYKNDQSFYKTDIPLVEILLSNSLKQIKSYKNDLSGSTSKRNKPNKDIIKLIKQGLIDTQMIITGGYSSNSVFRLFDS